ncbi:MAG TPA: phosphoribosylformylglycinamidine synthase, partial [Clostridiales bacterium]|nr:phosphoribosylformylglycinamidine synthase [Clostridiales bacterium]
RREKPEPGDVVILLGGRTGRDGCGGATGSSKAHTMDSLSSCGAEVQKGNPPTERKIQRLFRNPEVSLLIKKCNDFGAGGVSVAIGELADGLLIDLDRIPKKYEGLDGTELAISESQERMAVLVAMPDADRFIAEASLENLEATITAVVTREPRLKMLWRGVPIVDIQRDFLNTNGVRQQAKAYVKAPDPESSPLSGHAASMYLPAGDSLEERFVNHLSSLFCCSRKGLAERFDSTIGAGSVLMPFGGQLQATPAEGMAAKLPRYDGRSNTCTLMSFGFDPVLSSWSPFHGALYAVVHSMARITAMGGDYRDAWLTFQEYFERLRTDPERWGKPLAALLGAFTAQMEFGRAAIGGKDSMSGSFMHMDVPPTLVSFAVAASHAGKVLSPEFKAEGSRVLLYRCTSDACGMPDFDSLKKAFAGFSECNAGQGGILSASSLKAGGLAETVSKMCFGNFKGFEFQQPVTVEELFIARYGSLAVEITEETFQTGKLQDAGFELIGRVLAQPVIRVNGMDLQLKTLYRAWQNTLEDVFPTRVKKEEKPDLLQLEPGPRPCPVEARTAILSRGIAKPRVLIPVFPGTNCEYDSANAFIRAGAEVKTLVFRNIGPSDVTESIDALVRELKKSQIVMIPGGFSAGDEPEGSGKFISVVFRNPLVSDAVNDLLSKQDGLMLGICNGFQALVKLGLLPWGKIDGMTPDSPTLTFNTIGRHISRMVRTRIITNRSPWLSLTNPGDVHQVAVSHGEGRFHASREVIKTLRDQCQIATCYVEESENPFVAEDQNPNGSVLAIEGILSCDGRIFGKMGHSERIGRYVCKNVPGDKDQKLFEAGTGYFR